MNLSGGRKDGIIASMQTAKIDWANLGFRLNPAKTMYVAKTNADQQWEPGEFVDFGPLSISPAAGVLNYGQGILEGLKAFRTQSGKIALFRPRENAVRFVRGAQRLCMPPIPEQHFVDTLVEIVRRNRDYVPPCEFGSLYVRPCLWGTGEILGVGRAPEYCFVVYVSPVGHYFKNNPMEAVKFEVCDQFHRSAPRGVGSVKYIGNYAPTILLAEQARQRGFAGNLYLDAAHNQYVEEAGVANFFCVKGNQLLTPQLSESILSGVVRASIIQLAQEMLGMEVVETRLSIDTVLEADECFCSGTAAVVTPIGSITYQGREIVFGQANAGPKTRQLYQLLTAIQQGLAEDRFQWLLLVD
jgi:branched-chain amino acid aminotransferase